MFKSLVRNAIVIGVFVFGLASPGWAGPLDAAIGGGVSAAQSLQLGVGAPNGALAVTPSIAPSLTVRSAPAAATAAPAPAAAVAAPRAAVAEPARR